MNNSTDQWDRRKFLRGAALAGTAGLVGLRAEHALAEPPPETTRLKLVKIPSICQAPQYVAEALLKAEGFTDVEYVQKAGALGITEALAAGEANINNHFVAPSIIRVEAGDPIVFLGGLHSGCFELFGTDRIHGDSRPQGQDRRRPGAWIQSASLCVDHGGARRA